MLEGPSGEPIDLFPRQVNHRIPEMAQVEAEMAERAAGPTQLNTVNNLWELGWKGEIPETDGPANEIVCRESWLREPPTKLQLRLLHLLNEDGTTFEELRSLYPNRWVAGCWLKAHWSEFEAMGDLRFFV